MGTRPLCVSKCGSSGTAQSPCLDVGPRLEERQRGSATVQSCSVGSEMLLSKCDSAL